MDLRAIHVKSDSDLILNPEDFADVAVVRGVASEPAITLYAVLRVLGHDPVGSFAATLGEFVTCRLEAVAEAMTHFERSNLFAGLVDEIEEAVGAARIQKELAARLEEASGFTRDAAIAARTQLKFKSSAFRAPERAAAEFKRFRDVRCAALNDSRERMRETGQADAFRDQARELSLENARLMHGKLSPQQERAGGRGPDEYDVNTREPVWH